MLQFGSKHVCIEDVHIFKHCREMTLFLLWIGTYCINCVVQQTSGVKDLSSLVRQFFSCNKACSKYHTRSTTTPKYTHPQRLVAIRITYSYSHSIKSLELLHSTCGMKSHVVSTQWTKATGNTKNCDRKLVYFLKTRQKLKAWVALGKFFEEFVYLAVEIYHRGTLPSATPSFQVGKTFKIAKYIKDAVILGWGRQILENSS